MSYYRNRDYFNDKPKKTTYFTKEGWFVKEFTEEEERAVQEATEKKNGILDYNNLNVEVDTRWIGTMCELGFEAWCKEKGIYYDYYAEEDKKDTIDFTVGTFEIDVKGASTIFYPRPEYATNLDAKQYQKIMRKGYPVNTLVYARYLLPYRKAIIFGGVSKWKLKSIAEFYPAGTERPRGQNFIVLNTDNYEIEIGKLSSLDFIEKNRYWEWWH